jgi:hypothetical protein
MDSPRNSLFSPDNVAILLAVVVTLLVVSGLVPKIPW